jgi:tRNA A22 N-methylase
MTKRLNEIYSLISSGKAFGVVGCDHGYIAERVLKEGKFKKVIISDISSKSLLKAKNLLKKYGESVESIVSDGFKEYSVVPNEAVIAGMGGEEICQILLSSDKLPNRLILNPMKNTIKVRKTLHSLNYKILKDYTIFDGKFYDIILAEKGEDTYTEKEYIFGRDNLKNRHIDFINKLLFYKNLYENALKNSEDLELKTKLDHINEVLNENQ